jgi:hypothetical protein
MIATALGLDKKTVNQYAQRMLAINIPAGTDYVAALARLAALLPANKKPQPAYEVLRPYAEEIKDLITGNKAEYREGMQAKSAWIVLRRRMAMKCRRVWYPQAWHHRHPAPRSISADRAAMLTATSCGTLRAGILDDRESPPGPVH